MVGTGIVVAPIRGFTPLSGPSGHAWSRAACHPTSNGLARGEMPLGIESAILDRHGSVLLGACSAAARVSTGDTAVEEVRQFGPTATWPPHRLHAAAGAPVLRKARPATSAQTLPCLRGRMPIEMNSAMGTGQAATFVGGLGRMKISLLPWGTRTLDPKWKLRSRKADQAAIRYGMPSVQ